MRSAKEFIGANLYTLPKRLFSRFFLPDDFVVPRKNFQIRGSDRIQFPLLRIMQVFHYKTCMTMFEIADFYTILNYLKRPSRINHG